MRKAYAIGDCVLDIFFENAIPVEAKPGGSFLNSSVSLARLGVDISLISEIGEDRVGKQILTFLNENRVNTSTISNFTDTNSNLALAFLDEEKNADYAFYKTRQGKKSCICFPEQINRGDVILFGSFLAIKAEFRESLTNFLQFCQEKEAIIIYDPNFRTQHLPMLKEVLPYIKENMKMATIVKASNEDFELICGVKSGAEAKKWLSDFSDAQLIYTANKEGVFAYFNQACFFSVPQIHPVSTVGAGDTFNAAIAYFIIREEWFKPNLGLLSDLDIENLIRIAVLFSQSVCMGYDNFISFELASEYRIKKHPSKEG